MEINASLLVAKIKEHRRIIYDIGIVFLLPLVLVLSSKVPASRQKFSLAVPSVNQKNIQIQSVSSFQAMESAMTEGSLSPAGSDEIAGEQQVKEGSEAVAAQTQPRPKHDLTIGIISDAHVEPGVTSRVSSFSSLMFALKPDFIIELGDFVDNKNNGKRSSKEQGVKDFNLAKSMLRYSPKYYVLGNHELLSISKKDFKQLTGFNAYYSVRRGNYNIVVLDSNFSNKGDNVGPDDSGDYIGNIPSSQLKWLKGILKSNDNNIIFLHHDIVDIYSTSEIGSVVKDYADRIVMIASGHEDTAVSKKFKGVAYFQIPSITHNKSYAVVQIDGKKALVYFKKL